MRLSAQGRAAVEAAIRETCALRKWSLLALNVRTNHIHAVVSANCKPEGILSALKANATRQMKEASCWHSDRTPWAERGSKRYLWTDKQVDSAVAYVLYDQGESLLDD